MEFLIYRCCYGLYVPLLATDYIYIVEVDIMMLR